MSRYSIQFQSHTCTHPDLTALDLERVEYELLNSKKGIEDALGLPVRHLAYPFGAFNPMVMQLTEDAGYAAAYTFGKPGMDRYSRGRFIIHGKDGSLRFAIKVSGWSNWVRNILKGEHN